MNKKKIRKINKQLNATIEVQPIEIEKEVLEYLETSLAIDLAKRYGINDLFVRMRHSERVNNLQKKADGLSISKITLTSRSKGRILKFNKLAISLMK